MPLCPTSQKLWLESIHVSRSNPSESKTKKSISEAMQAGMAMAQQMMQENPEAVEQMRQMMGGMMGPGNPSSK